MLVARLGMKELIFFIDEHHFPVESDRNLGSDLDLARRSRARRPLCLLDADPAHAERYIGVGCGADEVFPLLQCGPMTRYATDSDSHALIVFGEAFASKSALLQPSGFGSIASFNDCIEEGEFSRGLKPLFFRH